MPDNLTTLSQSRPKRIAFIFGTRPEVIKLVSLITELRKHPELAEPLLISTGQQRDLTKQVLNSFSLVPDINLDIMLANQSLEDIVTNSLIRLSQALRDVHADLVVVQGDTSTAFVGALAGFYNKVPVAHLEAGLRTADIYQPFPEEVNRRLICPLASLHYAPTAQSRENLLREGVANERVLVTGNTGIDALRLTVERLGLQATGSEIRNVLDNEKDTYPTILITAHRRENFGKPLDNICDALLRLCKERPAMRIIFSVTPNPQVRALVNERLAHCSQITLLQPPEYPTFVQILTRCTLVLTDSGGIQEEAPFLGKPVLVMRQKTERPEGILSGNARLVGTDTDCIVESVLELLTDVNLFAEMATARNPYGDGHAAERIVPHLLGSLFGELLSRPNL